MPIVDAQGRLFGRLNILDAVLAILLLGLLPLGYAAYVLFRTPAPTLASVEPAVLTAGENLRVTVRGTNLRPYLRVSFGSVQGLTFLFEDSTHAQVELNPMAPGVYDVILYDLGQERARLPKALTITPSPLPDAQVVVVGALTGLKPADVPKVVVGMTIPGLGQVLEIGRPQAGATRVFSGASEVTVREDSTERLPVSLLASCYVRTQGGRPECLGAAVALHPTSMLTLDLPFGKTMFQIDQVRSAEALEPITATVRFAGAAEAVAQIKPGDVDLGIALNELAAGALVIAVSPSRALSANAAEREVTLRIRSHRDSAGWIYGAGQLRIGAMFLMRTPTYEASGLLIDLQSAASTAATSKP
jgi:hypothetical protein